MGGFSVKDGTGSLPAMLRRAHAGSFPSTARGLFSGMLAGTIRFRSRLAHLSRYLDVGSAQTVALPAPPNSFEERRPQNSKP